MIHDEIIIHHHHHHVMFYELICNKNNYFYRKKAASVPRQKFGMTKSCNTSYVRYLVLFNDTSSLVSLSFLSDKAFENFHTSESTNLTYSNMPNTYQKEKAKTILVDTVAHTSFTKLTLTKRR